MSPAGSIRPVLVFLVLLFPNWGCWNEVQEPPHPLQRNLLTAMVVRAAPAQKPVKILPGPPADQAGAYGMNEDACETFEVEVQSDGRRRYRRQRKRWTIRDERRFRALVDLVTHEMGAEPRLFRAWAQRESTHRPSAIHVLNGDVKGATQAWRKYTYSPEREAELKMDLDRLDRRDSKYWEARSMLSRIQTFRDNPYFNDVLEYDLSLPDGTSSSDLASIWAFGYGPFGFNPTYYLPLWDSNSPPWVFCGDDGLVAIVTAVWAAREHQRECASQGVGDSYLVLNRRFGTGHCANADPRDRFRTRLSRLGINPDARAKLGRKWPREDTDRTELLAHLRKRATEEGLTTSRPAVLRTPSGPRLSHKRATNHAMTSQSAIH